uniref:PNPLA domain-containing protein n=1 Tax=Globodera rostochiensis TaxID=31243 RepID=A0A914IDK6_GLORO
MGFEVRNSPLFFAGAQFSTVRNPPCAILQKLPVRNSPYPSGPGLRRSDMFSSCSLPYAIHFLTQHFGTNKLSETEDVKVSNGLRDSAPDAGHPNGLRAESPSGANRSTELTAVRPPLATTNTNTNKEPKGEEKQDEDEEYREYAKEGKSFVERNFDWIAGTSTGAIVALALADKTAYLECLRLYLRLKDEIFGAEAKARLGGYKAENLDLFLQEHFGKFRTMDQF